MAKAAPSSFLRSFSAFGLWLLGLGALGWLCAEFFMQGKEGWGERVLDVQYWSLKIHGLGILLYLPALGVLFLNFRERWQARFNRGGDALVAVLVAGAALSGWLLWYGPSGDLHDKISRAHWILGCLFLACLPLYFFTSAPRRPSRRRR